MEKKETNKTVTIIVATAAVVAGIAVVAFTCKRCIESKGSIRGSRR